jgi:hypothetical protein
LHWHPDVCDRSGNLAWWAEVNPWPSTVAEWPLMYSAKRGAITVRPVSAVSFPLRSENSVAVPNMHGISEGSDAVSTMESR